MRLSAGAQCSPVFNGIVWGKPSLGPRAQGSGLTAQGPPSVFQCFMLRTVEASRQLPVYGANLKLLLQQCCSSMICMDGDFINIFAKRFAVIPRH
jgi:hypothetical protein